MIAPRRASNASAKPPVKRAGESASPATSVRSKSSPPKATPPKSGATHPRSISSTAATVASSESWTLLSIDVVLLCTLVRFSCSFVPPCFVVLQLDSFSVALYSACVWYLLHCWRCFEALISGHFVRTLSYVLVRFFCSFIHPCFVILQLYPISMACPWVCDILYLIFQLCLVFCTRHFPHCLFCLTRPKVKFVVVLRYEFKNLLVSNFAVFSGQSLVRGWRSHPEIRN